MFNEFQIFLLPLTYTGGHVLRSQEKIVLYGKDTSTAALILIIKGWEFVCDKLYMNIQISRDVN